MTGSGRVYLVGAGPGHPGLLTLRAVECLAQADLVLYDRLVPESMLDHAPAHAERICLTALAESHVERCSPVLEILIASARHGKCVVRLKGGDPLVFGRGGEEAEALRRAGIPFEIVPGVTAALGAASFAGIPLTHRLHASGVALVTGHQTLDKEAGTRDWAAMARFPGTLVVYMGMTHLEEIATALVREGKPPDTPAALIHQATTTRQRTVETTLRDLASMAKEANIQPPALVVIGPVVRLRSEVEWFEKSPLFGLHVVVTRPRQQAGEMVRRLEQLGATVSVLPAVQIREPADWAPVDTALSRLRSYQWLVFTSSNGVHALLRRLLRSGCDLRALGPLRLAAIGPATAEALRAYHLEPDLVPEEFRSESLAAALKEKVAGQRVLLARADRGREVLRQVLTEVATVDQVAVYSQVDAIDPAAPALEGLRRGAVDYLTLTSSNIARAVIAALDAATRERFLRGEVKVVSISPVTSAAIHELGLPVAAEAVTYTSEGVIEALMRSAAARP
jgi:uroporphyrinogen III methyltransferase/synthase